jgi:hypothetical protein
MILAHVYQNKKQKQKAINVFHMLHKCHKIFLYMKVFRGYIRHLTVIMWWYICTYEILLPTYFMIVILYMLLKYW